MRLLPETPYDSYESYLAHVGQSALEIARSMAPDEIVRQVQESGLRGRGGAGFPTGTKWSALANHECPTRFVVCNGAEGEPGTFKDRYLIRRNPYATLEGVLIAAHALGSSEIYLAFKSSFTKELARMRQAIGELEGAGMLADVTIHVVEGPDEYLFGEEKALLNVIEGLAPMPREAHYPPYERGLFATPGSPNPALVNNAETYAHVATILRHGGAAFRAIGSPDTPGTVLLTISGDVARPGVFEVESGCTLSHVLLELAGGPLPGRAFKAALSGFSSGVIPAERFDTPLDFGSLQLIGAGLGSGGFMVFDDSRSMARVAQTAARFLYVESCSQCPACKSGLEEASERLDQICEDEAPHVEGAAEDILESAHLGAQRAPQGNRCYLPVQGATLIPSLMARYRPEFLEALAAALPASERLPVPKIVDFDETSRVFTHDEKQNRKLPDWTFSAEEEEQAG